jgi:tetratricopeptide (TPR) repeat protein
VISLFATSKERDKERLMVEDMKTLPKDAFEIWHDHLDFLKSEGRLSTSEKSVLRSIALALRAVPAIDFEVLENFYDKIFRGNLSEFDYALDEVVKKFFIGIEDKFCSMHAVQAAVVEEKYPVEERLIERLKEVLTSLEKERSLVLLSGFAVWFYENKKYKDYLTLLDVFIEKEPEFAIAYDGRGTAYAKLNQHERAIDDHNKAIELNPSFAVAYYNRGNAYAKLNQYERAIQDYDKAIELNPNFTDAYVNRGNTYAELNQREGAIRDFNKAIDLKPNFTDAYVNRGNAYTKLNQHERAFHDYDKAIELNPNYARAYNNRGIAYDELNQHERAFHDYDKAIELDTNYAETYNNRGVVYDELNRHERAIRDYDRAIELNPKYAKAYNNRGVAYVGLNQYKRAIQDYDKAVGVNPHYAEAYGNRGIANLKIRNYKGAARDLKKGGVLFLKSRREEDAKRTFSAGFDLRKEVENKDIVYCGLVLFLITLNPDVIITLRKMQIQDETLRIILELAVRKLQNEDVSEEVRVLNEKEKREEMRILLELLKRL